MAERKENNIRFLCAARVAGRASILASFSYNCQVDLDGIRKVLEEPNMQLQLGRHYSFSSSKDQVWHFMSDEMGLIYVLISSDNYPTRCAHTCLLEWQRAFVAKVGGSAASARDGALNSLLKDVMGKTCERFDNVANVDKLAALTAKVDSVKLEMQANIQKMLENTVMLENVQHRAEELQKDAGIFSKRAQELKNKMWWKNMRMKLAIGGTILAILTIIIVIIACEAKKNGC